MLAQSRYMVLDSIDDNSTTQTAGSADPMLHQSFTTKAGN